MTDAKRVNARLLTDDSADGEILNIGSTDNIDSKTLAEVIRDEIDPSLGLEYADQPTGDAQHTHADVSKAHDLLGYEPTTDIREGGAPFSDWDRGNREWDEPLVLNS